LNIRYLGEDELTSTPIESQKGFGDIAMSIDHVDNYDEHYQYWTRTKFITYMKKYICCTWI